MTQQEIIKKYLPAGSSPEIHGRVIMVEVPQENLEHICLSLSKDNGLPLKTMFAADDRDIDGAYKIYYVFGVPKENYFIVPFLRLKDTLEFPSLAGVMHQTSLYEPHIHEMFGLIPTGYPAKLQPAILHDNWPINVHPMRKDFRVEDLSSAKHAERLSYEFTTVEGEGIYEVPVGPVHAGIIEPGHFRFSMAGEVIINLEAKLGWVHKGSEKLFETLPLHQKLLLSERIAGDTSFAHSTAFAMGIEELAGIKVPMRALYLRVIFGELERLAAHFNDIGFIMSDTGFNFGGAQCTRLRERVMCKCEYLTGSRFLRGVNVYGGVARDIKNEDLEELKREIKSLGKELAEVMDIAKESSVLENRLHGTGSLAHSIAKDHDAVGVPARASGIEVDARIDFPYAAYDQLTFTESIETSGDVQARLRVRINEVYSSIEIIDACVKKMSPGDICAPDSEVILKPNAITVSVAEGWRGDIVYVVCTDKNGKISRVSVRDPSFINWNLIPHAAPGNVLLDFPLINKSFNLSYTGYDR